MFNCSNRCIKQHPWAGESHHFTYARSHFGFITVGGAALATGFVIAISAMFQSVAGVVKQSSAIPAKLFVILFLVAVEFDHELYNFLFFFYAHC